MTQGSTHGRSWQAWAFAGGFTPLQRWAASSMSLAGAAMLAKLLTQWRSITLLQTDGGKGRASSPPVNLCWRSLIAETHCVLTTFSVGVYFKRRSGAPYSPFEPFPPTTPGRARGGLCALTSVLTVHGAWSVHRGVRARERRRPRTEHRGSEATGELITLYSRRLTLSAFLASCVLRHVV